MDAEYLLWATDLAKYWLDLDLSILVTTPRGRDLSHLKDEKMDLATRINSFNNIAYNSDNETIVPNPYKRLIPYLQNYVN